MEMLFYWAFSVAGILICLLITHTIAHDSGKNRGRKQTDEYWQGRMTLNNVGYWDVDKDTGVKSFHCVTLPEDFLITGFKNRLIDVERIINEAEEYNEIIRAKSDQVASKLTIAIGRLNSEIKALP